MFTLITILFVLSTFTTITSAYLRTEDLIEDINHHDDIVQYFTEKGRDPVYVATVMCTLFLTLLQDVFLVPLHHKLSLRRN